MRNNKWLLLLVPLAVLAGIGLAYIDTRPTWDDAGITAGMLLVVSALLGFLSPRRPWIWALAVGIWIPLRAIIFHQDFLMLIVLGFSFAGAYLGMVTRRLLLPPRLPAA